MTEGSVYIPGEWTLGYRPKVWMQNNPAFHMKVAQQIKGFYLELPKYVSNYTDFNCGHMATHYTANHLQCEEIHMYGFDSIFDFNLRSCTDMYLNADRSLSNNNRLANNWRPVWGNLFNEFPNTEFIIHHEHNDIKIKLPKNVTVNTK
jgi:hypothetical protein